MGPTGSAGPPVGRALAIELRREQRVATIDADVKSGLFDATLDDHGLPWSMKTGSSSCRGGRGHRGVVGGRAGAIRR